MQLTITTNEKRKHTTASPEPPAHFLPPLLPPLPPLLSIPTTPRPPVKLLIALRSLTRPLVCWRALGASSETLARLFEGVAPMDERIERALFRSADDETSFASNCTEPHQRQTMRKAETVTHLALDVLLPPLTLQLVVKPSQTRRTPLRTLQRAFQLALALLALSLLRRRLLRLLRCVRGCAL